ncbi:hypothetical protein NGB36_10030 [Streptomyces sp. RB6PN25]|uniref:Uncharacterized protein n=1 Tax=Streptomyces humicola TaxID=2953240 RepID=A0ABT1PTC2_9ACTN|nr:hypothetical protein [Streptomyces humicola]MCQ4080929.1 hypothetical protein [Streptomyces humicola]
MRSWSGDVVLSEQLEAVADGGESVLRPLLVDLEELSGLLEGNPAWGGGRILVTTGECWPVAVGADASWTGASRRMGMSSGGWTSRARDRVMPTATWRTSSRRSTSRISPGS